MAWDSDEADISVCYHCSSEIDEPLIKEMFVEEK